MDCICLILIISASALWFFSIEYPALFGVYVPTCAMRRRSFNIIAGAVLLAALMTSGALSSKDAFIDCTGVETIGCRKVIVVLLSSLIMLTVLRLFSVHASAAYAMIGSFVAVGVCENGLSWGVARIAGGMLASPFIAFLLSSVIMYAFRRTLGRSRIHLITLSHYMRMAVIAGIVMTSAAIGLNWGGFIMAVSGLVSPSCASLWLSAAIVALVLLVMTPFMRDESDENALRYGDFSVYNVLAAGLSTAVTLLIFSFEASAGLIGLVPMPLSAGVLVLASIAGAEMAQRSHLIEREEYYRGAIGLVAAPAGSFLLAYLILRISGAGQDAPLADFTLMSAAILVLVALFFAGYIRNQKRQREATERIVYSQQQQIYENARALNDMELRVVLSENQALHNAVEMKKQEVMNVALSIVEQREYLESLDNIVKRLATTSDEEEKNRLVAELSASLKQRLSYDRDVDSQYFYAQAEYLHEDFNAKLSENFPDLTQQEKRLATLLRLGFSSKYIATLMNITPKSVEISRYRLRQKLGLSKGDNLVNFIKSI